MRKIFNIPRSLLLALLCFAVFGLLASKVGAQDAATAITKETIAELDKELNEAKAATSETRQRIAVRRVISTAEELVAAHANDTSRFLALEFLFRAYQRLIALDKDAENRKAFLETCRELVKAPDELAALRLEADLLLTQAEQALILNTAIPPASASPDPIITEAETTDLSVSDAVGFVSKFVSGEAPKDKKSEWEILGTRNRAALNQNFARELPLEYRATLKNYYERVAK